MNHRKMTNKKLNQTEDEKILDPSTSSYSESTKHGYNCTCFYYLPVLTSLLALVFSVASSVSCTFTNRNFTSQIASNVNINYLDLELGIWTWRGLVLTNDDNKCFAYNVLKDDDLIFSARLFSILSGMLGINLVVASIWVAIRVDPSVNGFTLKNRVIAGSCFLLVALFESFKFRILRGDICNDERVEELVVTYDSCTLASGAYLCIISIVVWVITAFSCFRAPSNKKLLSSDSNDSNCVAIELEKSFDIINNEYQ